MSILSKKNCHSFSQTIFDDNVAMINKHNFEADLGLHSYTLKINQFADMVNVDLKEKIIIFPIRLIKKFYE